MAARSFTIGVDNFTRLQGPRTKEHLDHGIWTEGLLPPENLPPITVDPDIEPGQVLFESESDGFMTGCEGTVVYSTQNGDVTIYFDNPYAGSNKFNVTVPDGYQADWGDISGNNASVKVTISKKKS